MKELSKPFQKYWPFFAMVVTVWFFFHFLAWLFSLCGEIEGLAQVGNASNIISSLFSGLAFVALIVQLGLYRQQLKDEREANQRTAKMGSVTILLQHSSERLRELKKQLISACGRHEQIDVFSEIDFFDSSNRERLQSHLLKQEQFLFELFGLNYSYLQIPLLNQDKIKEKQDRQTLSYIITIGPLIDEAVGKMMEFEIHTEFLTGSLGDEYFCQSV